MFNGIWLVASEPLTVGSREYAEGERFEISRTHSGALLVMGRAMIAPKVTPATEPEVSVARRRGRPRKVQTAVIPDAAEGTDPVHAEMDEPPKRQYRRRDLEAEE